MEPIYEIVSVSHNGYGQMWYPFSFDTNSGLTLIHCKNRTEAFSLQTLIGFMFAKNNDNVFHRSNFYSFHGTMDRSNNITECEIIFKSSIHEYRMIRKFDDSHHYSEFYIEKIGSGICYYGNEAISLFRKFQSPVVFEGKCNNYNRAVIQMPYDENSRIRMQEMVQRWMKILGYNNGSVYLSPNGTWGFRNRENYIDNKQKAWNIISLLAIFAQAIYKTIRIGYTSPLVMYFEMDLFSRFEIESILNLINSICSEHSINAIMISDIENVDTKLKKIIIPDSSLYT